MSRTVVVVAVVAVLMVAVAVVGLEVGEGKQRDSFYLLSMQ